MPAQPRTPSPVSRPAFSLVELLAVMVVIVFLLGWWMRAEDEARTLHNAMRHDALRPATRLPTKPTMEHRQRIAERRTASVAGDEQPNLHNETEPAAPAPAGIGDKRVRGMNMKR